MKHKLFQQQRMLQKMALTPQMRLSIKLLGMSVNDLDEYIDSVLAKNPFLQKLVGQDRRGEYRKDASRISQDAGSSTQYTDRIAQKENPREVLLSQLKVMGLETKTLEIAEYLIYEMDDNGYIKTEINEVAGELSAADEDVEKALAAIQDMEPAGIGARDVRECLELQLKRAGKYDSLEYKIVTEFISELARNDIAAIADDLGMDEKTVESAVKNIKKLSPRPAMNILAEKAEEVVPELIAKVDKKKTRLEINRQYTPQLKLYNPYGNKLDIIKDPEARKFMSLNMDAASKLIDSLKRREDTICKVAKFILEVQRDAFVREGEDAKNARGIKALTLRDVATALNFHPSTISRAISNKYIEINNRVIPLKKMLSDGLKKESGEVVSKTDIKTMIAMLVKNEDRSKPLSDTQIEDCLKAEGMIIKRRTVAKYRTALRILPAHLRKKL